MNNKKLQLTKISIANLDSKTQSRIKGGTYLPTCPPCALLPDPNGKGTNEAISRGCVGGNLEN